MLFGIINKSSEKERLLGEEPCWYLAYGSNLYFERFSHYLWGGKSNWPSKQYDGCRWPSNPVMNKRFTSIRNDVYFAKESSLWQNRGVAFMRNEESDDDISEVITYCRAYLIKKHQLIDIVRQENSWKSIPDIDFGYLEKAGNLVLPRKGWYNKIKMFGWNCNYPIFTILPEKDWTDDEINDPSYLYLKTIVLGLYQGCNLSPYRIATYLNSKDGIAYRDDVTRDVEDIFWKNHRDIDNNPDTRWTK